MSLLATIRKGKRSLPPRVLIYGTGGIGLSTFASEAPSPIFLSVDGATDRIGCDSLSICRSFDEITLHLKSLSEERHGYQTLVIDTLDWAEKLILAEVRKPRETECVVKSDGGYGQNDDFALFYWRRMIDALNPLRDEKEMAIVLLAHEKTENQSETRPLPSPKLHKPATALWYDWCDAVLHATFDSEAAGPEKNARVLRRDPVAACNIKNRYNIPEVLPLRWSSLAEFFAPASDASS